VRPVTPVTEQQEFGSIVNISTYAAFEPSLTFLIFASIRAALASFAKLFADRYAMANIRMNSVLPGYIDSYQVSDDVSSNIPMGRAGKVAEIAKTVAFLLSSDTGYITGQNIRVDDGLSRSI